MVLIIVDHLDGYILIFNCIIFNEYILFMYTFWRNILDYFFMDPEKSAFKEYFIGINKLVFLFFVFFCLR